jgi:PEGA domain
MLSRGTARWRAGPGTEPPCAAGVTRCMETPGDRIVREFRTLPRREHVRVLIDVMRQLGLAGYARRQFLSRAGEKWMMLGVALLVAGMGVAFWYGKHTFIAEPPARARLEVSTSPPDASVAFDDRAFEDRPRFSIIGKAGQHVVTVTRPGYVPRKETVWLTTERPLQMHVALELSDATGFEITSDPPGMGVWLDAEQIRGPFHPILTNLREGKVALGRHVIDVLDACGRFVPWRQEVFVEAGRMLQLHAHMQAIGDRTRQVKAHLASKKAWLTNTESPWLCPET